MTDDTEPVRTAARAIAIAEDRTVFHGLPAARIRGMCAAAGEDRPHLGDDVAGYPGLIAAALSKLRDRGSTTLLHATRKS